MRHVILAVLGVPLLFSDAAYLHAEDDEGKLELVCESASHPPALADKRARSERQVLDEYGGASREWWFRACHGVVVKEFCRDKKIFNQGQPDAPTDLEQRLNEEALWLRILGQAPLPKLSRTDEADAEVEEAYRFLWRPSFFSPPTVIVVHRSGDKLGFYATQFCWPRQKVRELTEAEWKKILGFLEESKFWTMPTFGGSSGLDGGQWLLEGYSDKRYHVVDRWSPLGTPLGELGKYLLGLSEFKPYVIH